MTRRDALFLGWLMVALPAAACTRSDKAIEPAWGKEPCAHCAMILSDKRFAAQVVDAAGERRFFDDLGCMVLDQKQHGAPRRAWVHDANDGAWLDAETARYAPASGTPMDFGFEAHGSATAGGLGWSEMRDRVLAKAGGVP